MKSDTRDQGDIRIIELGGKITIGSGDVKIRELVSQAIDDDKKNILFDLGGVTAIDSSGIGEMVACYTSVTKRGGQLKLMHLSPKINDILQVTLQQKINLLAIQTRLRTAGQNFPYRLREPGHGRQGDEGLEIGQFCLQFR